MYGTTKIGPPEQNSRDAVFQDIAWALAAEFPEEDK